MPEEEELSEEEIKKKIKEKKAEWEAGKTSMSKLSPEERKKRLGLIPTEEEMELIRKKKLDRKPEE